MMDATSVSARFRVSLLGPFAVFGPDGDGISIASKKNRILLAMLAVAPEKAMTRDALAAALWSDFSQEQASNSLRQALAVLRKEVRDEDGQFFELAGSRVGIRADRVHTDVDDFNSSVVIGTAEAMEGAVKLWRGQFVEDVPAPDVAVEQWLSERREHFNSLYLSALDRLATLLSGEARIRIAERLVKFDNLREASHRRLMEAYVAAGERAKALRHYEKLRKLLRDELGVEPSAETRELGDRISSAGSGGDQGVVTGKPAAHRRTAAGPAVTAPVGAENPPAPTASAAPPGRGSGEYLHDRRFYAVAALVVIVFAVGAAWYFGRSPSGPAAVPSVAVLPFESLSAEPDDARIAEGLTIDTISDLARYSDFRVMAKDTTDAYKGKAVDIRALGKDLKVSHFLKGTYQRDKDNIRITAQLIDATTAETLWSDRYDRLTGEIFAIQSDVADHIANSLVGQEGKVGKSVLANARRKPPADLGVYETYLVAQEMMYSDLSDEHMRDAEKILDQVIARDPTFARAYVRYANSFAWRATYESGAAELLQQMVNYSRKAVALDPMDADAHAALGYSLTLTGDPKQGEVHLDEALRLTPNAFDILIYHACMDHAFGKADKGAEAADRALAINPAYPNYAVPCMRLAAVLVGRYDEAIRIQSRQPENEMNTDGFVVLAGSLASLGRSEEAKGVVARGMAKYPGLLSIERFALNRNWPPDASKVMVDLMRRAGFPACATSQELADTPNPVRLPECTG